MQYASSVTRSGIQTFARYKNIKSGFVPPMPVVTGGTLSSDATYYYRTFTATSNLVVSAASLAADVLVVAGGGGGGTDSEVGGGGGGGGLLTSTLTIAPNTYAVTVGAGGSRGSGVDQSGAGTGSNGTNGANSVFSTLTAIGGGAGATRYNNGVAGGSGGGAGDGARTGGAGTAGQGYAGGNSGAMDNPTSNLDTGAGGGAGGPATGSPAQTTPGPGLYSAIGSGTFSKGGNIVGSGGWVAGVDNSGNGGSGARNGGSGIVVVRYLKTAVAAPTDLWQADSFKSYLKVATPFSTALSTSDYSATISGTGSNRTMTAVNSPTLATGVYKSYGSSLYLGAYSDNKYVGTPTNANLQIGTNDFTIEGWFYFTTVSAGYQALASHAGDTGDSQPGWILITESNNYLNFYSATSGGGWSTNVGSTATPTLNAWSHIAVSRSGSTLRMFLNGTQIGSTSNATGSIGLPASQTLRIGHYNWFPGGARGMSGYVQDFRFYVGAAKYTGAFTPPAQMYVG